jgi:hypothetical protein
VLAGAETGGIAALGDSLTDGNISTMDAFAAGPIARARLMARPAAGDTVMNQNSATGFSSDIRGDSGLRRFD